MSLSDIIDHVGILVTGRFWVGASGARCIAPALTELISKARQDIVIVAYRFTIAHEDLRKSLEFALGRGCIVKVILDASGTAVQAERSYFDKLSREYEGLTIWDFCDNENNRNIALHAKLIIVDRHTAIVGSANFSHNGLVENHELAISLKGKSARALCGTVETLIKEASKSGVLIKRERTSHA
jgi:phosphatidylserine/phosphatidylglycerophosphate/cardiolipin synthase-like enzyme